MIRLESSINNGSREQVIMQQKKSDRLLTTNEVEWWSGWCVAWEQVILQQMYKYSITVYYVQMRMDDDQDEVQL